MSSTPTAALVKDKLTRELEATYVEVEDITAEKCSTSFRVLVVSPKFENKQLLQRHRMVNACLAEELQSIHAFEQKTLSPAQWEQLNAQ